MTTVAIIIACLVALWLVVGLLLQRVVLYPRHLVQVPPASQELLGQTEHVQRLSLQTDAGPVDMWYIPPPEASAKKPAGAVIFAHGNAELIDYWPTLLQPYRDMNLAVLLVEYRGYGRSAGSPTQQGIVADFVQGYDWLAAREQIDADRIVGHGRSLGAGVVCALSRERPLAALVLQSGFASAGAMAWRAAHPGFLMRDPYDNLAALRAFDGPVLIMHGRHDRIVPPRHADRLHAASPNSRLVYFNSGHNDFPITSTKYWDAVGAFLRQAQIIG